jgi:hypothetical protein
MPGRAPSKGGAIAVDRARTSGMILVGIAADLRWPDPGGNDRLLVDARGEGRTSAPAGRDLGRRPSALRVQIPALRRSRVQGPAPAEPAVPASSGRGPLEPEAGARGRRPRASIGPKAVASRPSDSAVAPVAASAFEAASARPDSKRSGSRTCRPVLAFVRGRDLHPHRGQASLAARRSARRRRFSGQRLQAARRWPRQDDVRRGG